MKTRNLYAATRFTFLLLISTIASVVAQEDSSIITAYEDYTEVQRELAYLHLNKSIYIKGEDIGFTAYVLNKSDKERSLVTTNLYVSIEDENKQTIKQQLLRVERGIASNAIEIDSSFTPGQYTIKAYTSWMRNFNEPNYFIETIKIIDPQTEQVAEQEHTNNSIDAQFLPESGHLLHGVQNNIGAIIKDSKGYGIPFLEGEVVDKNDNVLTTFKTNKLGIGRFGLIPDITNSYRVKMRCEDKDLSFNLNQQIQKNGVLVSVKSLKSKVFVSVITNEETLEVIKNKRHTLMIHNGDLNEVMDLYFTDETTITKVIDTNSSPAGVNILTLFNEDDKPIAERLFFNYNGIDIIKSNGSDAIKNGDSLKVKLSFKGLDPNSYNTLSVSVLPKDTKSNGRNHNIISYNFLQPYLNGVVEQAKYYFTDIDAKKQYELDNLLITQGWSSYNWDEIFNIPEKQIYPFEQGITIKANINPKDKKNKTNLSYIMHAINDEEPRLLEVEKDNSEFIIENVFPENTNEIYLSKLNASNELTPSQLYLQFFPNTIPPLHNNRAVLLPKTEDQLTEKLKDYNNNMSFSLSNKVQKLDEVTITSRVPLKTQRRNELSRGRLGKIAVVDEQDENSFLTLWRFLIYKAWILLPPELFGPEGPRDTGSSAIGSNAGNPNTPNFFLNDVLLMDLQILDPIFLSEVDFVEINRFGLGDGMRSPSGSIKIYTHKSPKRRYSKTTTKAYQIPLTFSAQKQFYVPKYKYYNDDFYRDYGTVDWKPNLEIDDQGQISFKIAKPEVPITLFIEGIANDGSFIFEEKSIVLN